MTEGVSEDRVAVARATTCFRVAFAESDLLADLKLRLFLRRLFKELAEAACFPFTRGASCRVWRWSMCSRRSFGPMQRKGCRPSENGVFDELISLTSLLSIFTYWSSSFGEAGRSCRSSLARGDGSRASVRRGLRQWKQDPG